MASNDPPDDWGDEEFEGSDDDLDGDCGMGPDGQCSMAGSEWCDWCCPRSMMADDRADHEAARRDPDQMDLGL